MLDVFIILPLHFKIKVDIFYQSMHNYDLTSASLHIWFWLHIPFTYCCTSVLILSTKLLKIIFFFLIFTFSSLTHTSLCSEFISISKYIWSSPWQDIIAMLVNCVELFWSKSYLFLIRFNGSLNPFWNITWLRPPR